MMDGEDREGLRGQQRQTSKSIRRRGEVVNQRFKGRVCVRMKLHFTCSRARSHMWESDDESKRGGVRLFWRAASG